MAGKTILDGSGNRSLDFSMRGGALLRVMMIYLLAHWLANASSATEFPGGVDRPVIQYTEIDFYFRERSDLHAPISHAGLTFVRDDTYANYFENSVKAPKAHKLFACRLQDRFSRLRATSVWGIARADYVERLQPAWGGRSLNVRSTDDCSMRAGGMTTPAPISA